ncbi:MAG TPA: response regulator [Symbiobacteriaceae bacterium]|nr:response regulator [Symbiobacteriaceae bacterium]
MEFAALLQDVFAGSLDGIVIADSHTVIQDVNPAYEAITGFSRLELIGQKTNVLKSGLTPDETFVEMWDGLTNRGQWVGEVINRRKDGSLWHSYLSITRVDDEDGGVAAYVAIIRDITKRKLMETQLRLNLAEIETAQEQAVATVGRLQAILESVGEAIIMVDVRGVCVVANHKIGGVLGIPAEQLAGRTVHDLRAAAHRAFRTEGALAWQSGPMGGPPVEIGTTIMETRETHPRVFHEFSAPVQDDYGAVIGRIYVYRDVTKETEVDRMKTDFIATVSHELRTPMTSIKGSLGLVLGGVTGPLPEDVTELLSIAMNNTDRLVRLINDILDVSRIEAGKMEIRRQPLSMADVIQRAVREMQGYADQRSITMTSVVPDDLPRVLGDADRLQQVLVNLLSNAIKFSDVGSVVTLTAGHEPGGVWVRVEDNGPGIDESQHEAIFEKFHRVDNASSRRTGGSGLGLAICKAIVEEHGGQIWVESEPGRGSAFTFSLKAEPTPAEFALPIAPAGKTVLVVDDDPDIVKLIGLSLEQEGFGVVGATSGDEALSIARSRHIDAITLDLMMPDLHGLEVARRLKADPATRSIPVVVVSAYTRERDSELLTMGLAGVLSKPIDEGQMLSLIRSIVGDTATEGKGPPSILVVDDDQDVRRIVRVILERRGYVTYAAADGQEAYRMIMEQRPNLLILDLLMPNMDGFQLVRLLRQRRWTQRIPLLVLTALDLTEGERTLLTLGPTRHLTKGPHIQEEVVARVKELLR